MGFQRVGLRGRGTVRACKGNGLGKIITGVLKF